MITTVSKQGGRRYSQFCGSSFGFIRYIASRGTSGAAAIVKKFRTLMGVGV